MEASTSPHFTPSNHFTQLEFHSDEEIMENMIALEYPWDNLHHQYYYLPMTPTDVESSNQFNIEAKDFILARFIDWFQHPIPTLDTFKDGNMENISPIANIEISCTP